MSRPTKPLIWEGTFATMAQHVTKDYAPNWAGVTATGESLATLRHTWPEGVKAMEKLPTPELPPRARAKVSDWNQGDVWDLQKLRDGRAPWTRRSKKPAPSRTIIVNIAEGAFVNAQAMLYKAFTAMRLIDELENQGTAVKVVAAMGVYKGWIGHSGHSLALATVKDHDEPLNLGLLATALSPWSLRAFYIGWTETRPFGYEPEGGKGYAELLSEIAKSVPSVFEDEPLMIDRGQCLSLEDARQYIDAQKEANQ
jgi:hypothetical protein